ncbi:MAG: DUF2436 domain-containing protein [Muribaculaceae bacterium]|nr:DUF2436 domain-containing protein [Muribaculaceae bacterium]
MKKIFLFALMAAMGIPMLQAQQSLPTKALSRQAVAGIRHTDRVVTVQTPVQFKASFNDAVPEGMAVVILTAGDVWGDGSGYQMLLDADATAYGTLFPEAGPLTSGGDADAALYAEFEYKIPENADGACNTTNMVLNNSVSILIPAGVYDYVIPNPSPGDRVWIASPFGNIGGRYDDFTFEAGKIYTFTVSLGSNGNDATDLVVESSEPTEGPTVPVDLVADPAATTAAVTWSDYDDSQWNLRYRVYNPDADADAVSYFWDFENGMDDWTSIDADGDGYGWYVYDPISAGYDPGDGIVLFDTKCATSASYMGGVLYPDNWLVSPQVALEGQFTFWAGGQDANWAGEVFAVYATTGDPNDVSGYVKLSEDITATSPIKEYTFDLTSFAGQQGYVAIRHYNVSDMFRLNIDNVNIGTKSAPAPWIVVNGLTDPSYIIENLAPGTTYEVQVQAANEKSTSEWSESTIFTTRNDQAITAVYLNGYESPVEGENSQDHLNLSVPEGANYHIYVTSWSPEWWDNDVDDEFFGTFVGGTRYSVGATLEANDGYYFADDCVFYVNGSENLVDYNYTGVDEDYNTYAYVWTVPEVAGNETESYVITEVYVYGYESPVAGEDSQAHLNITVPEDAKYSIFANTWSPEWWDNDADDDFFGIFVEGTYYSVGMTLEANEGYRFADDCVFYVNGSEALVDYDYTGVESEDGNIYAYLWTIPEAAQAAAQPTEKTGAPTFHGYTEDGIHAYFVEIIPTEPSVIYYRVIYPDGTESEWTEYEEILSFTGDGKYRVEAYAVADGKLPSEEIAYEFVVAPVTGIEEMVSGKQVAGVRYFNAAGQEMQEANGLTIVVTTYTDGSTSTVKVVK